MLRRLFAAVLIGVMAAAAVVLPAQTPADVPAATAKAEAPDPIYSPDSSVQYALADLAGIPEEHQPYIRYLSMYNLPAVDRKKAAQTVSFVVNSLSRRKQIRIPVYVGNSGETVIRINLFDYDIDPKDWDDLGKNGSGIKPVPDPYFHAFKEKIVPPPPVEVDKKVTKTRSVTKYRTELRYDPRFGGQVQVQVPYQATEEYTETVKAEAPGNPAEATKEKILVDAPWINAAAIAKLRIWTKSEFPVLRADWFTTNAIQPPAYYKFFKLGNNLKDFEKLVGANLDESLRLRGADKAMVVTSSVARNNRTITRSGTLNGGYIWITNDSLKSVDDRQYAVNLLNAKFDATEVLATLPNRLYVWFLTDGAGKRVDFANPDVAIDSTAADKIVRCGRSCMICHSDGIRPIEDEVRKITELLTNKAQVRLLVPDKKDYEQIVDLFGGNLDKQAVRDAQIYADAVAEANGLDMRKNATQLGFYYDRYAETLLTREMAARECGLTMEDFEKYIKLSTDNVVLGFTKDPIRPVRRDQWERSFQEFMLLLITAKERPVPVPVPQKVAPGGAENWGGSPVAVPGKSPTVQPPAVPVPLPPDKVKEREEGKEPEIQREDDSPLRLRRKVDLGKHALASLVPIPMPKDEEATPKAPPSYAKVDKSVNDKVAKALKGDPPAKTEAAAPAVPGPKGTVVTTVRIRMQRADAKLVVNKTEIKSTGLVRTFQTPPLPVGQEFTYQFHCFWESGPTTNVTSKEVRFKAGDTVEVDLTE